MSSLCWNSELQRWSMHSDAALRHFRVTVFLVDNAISTTHSSCVFVALVTQHAERMHYAILLSVACPAQHFSTLSHKRHD